MKVVILCGGIGSRLAEETKLIPKPMVKVGNLPIVQHIINYYKRFGLNEFILATGYKKEIFIALRAINDRKLIPQIRNHFLSDNKEVFEVQRNGEKKIYSLRCPHLGMRLDPSNLNKNGELICPGHGWRFSLENGKCVFGDLSQSIVIKDCSTKKNN